jgi:pyridoxal phosphate enzyme (YggS family)
MRSVEERIRQNLQHVRGRIAEAAKRSGRSAGAVRLVAVTKKWPVDLVRLLVEAGARDLGENYPQELWRKAETLGVWTPPIRWHLIGHLQSNKARRTLPLVTMIHSVDSLRLLSGIQLLGEETGAAPELLLQVNTSGEASKHGWAPSELLHDAEAIAGCNRVPIVGLMTMAAWGTDAETARPSFVQLRELRDELARRTGLGLAELSMGMSGDFEAAVEEGATLVRIGTALLEGIEV